MNNKPRRNDVEDDEGYDVQGQLGFFSKSKRSNQYDVYIDTPFFPPSFYRGVAQMLYDASEDDLVVFHVNSPGGRLDGLQTLMEAVKNTEAQTIAVIEGDCASAASIFVMYVDEIFVSDSASMLCHNVSYGTSGKGNDNLAYVQHISKTSEKLVRDSYQGYLSEQEILELLNGREIHLDAMEIRERLTQRGEYYKLKYELEQEALKEPEPKPKKAAKKA